MFAYLEPSGQVRLGEWIVAFLDACQGGSENQTSWDEDNPVIAIQYGIDGRQRDRLGTLEIKQGHLFAGQPARTSRDIGPKIPRGDAAAQILGFVGQLAIGLRLDHQQLQLVGLVEVLF